MSSSSSNSNNDEEEDYQSFNESYFTRIYEQEKMLSDKRRMDFYYNLIKKYVKASSKMTVLDVGTGTGVLACWSCLAGASKVIAIDHSEKNIHLAATLADNNNCQSIEFMVGHSSQFKCKKKVDMIIHEQIGDILFDEYMIETICDLRQRVLKRGGKIVPSKFSLYIEPVQLDNDRHVSMMRNIQSHGLDFSCLQNLVEKPSENPDYYHFRSSDYSIVDHLLAEPSSCWNIDLYTIKNTVMSSDTTLQFTKTVTSKGRMDALCVYFQCNDDDESSNITNGPSKDRCSHWGMRFLRVPEMLCSKGDRLEINISVEESWEDLNSWRWNINKHSGDDTITASASSSLTTAPVDDGSTTSGITFLSAAEIEALRNNNDDSSSIGNSGNDKKKNVNDNGGGRKKKKRRRK